MDTFNDYLDTVINTEHRVKLETLFAWISSEFPSLKQHIGWNQPMFTDHGTFIIGFSSAKAHFSVSPDEIPMAHFKNAIDKAGFSQTPRLFRIKWTDELPYDLLKTIITYNIENKKETTTFWWH